MEQDKIKTPVGEKGLNDPDTGNGNNPDTGNPKYTTDDKGNMFNEDGKPVDKDGNVIESTPTEQGTDPDKTDGGKQETGSEDESVILIDEEEYKLDAEGNALDKDGNIFKSKDELAQLEKDSTSDGDGNDEDLTIKDLEKLSGISITNENGEEEEFDFTLESLAKREKRIKELGLEEGKNEAIDSFFKNNPDLYQAYMYKTQKGSLEGFSNKPYYQSIEPDTSNDEQMFNFIVEAEVAKGASQDRAKKFAEYIKSNNELSEVGKESYDYLKANESKEFESFEQQKQQAQQKAIEQEINFYGTYFDKDGKEVIVNKEGTVYDKIVNKGQFGNYVIPESGIQINNGKDTKKLTRKDIFDYISKPVKDGLTQAQLDEQSRLSKPDTLLQQYINNLTGNDMTKFIERKVLEEKGKRIKSRLRTKSVDKNVKPNSNSEGKLKIPVK